MLDRTLARFKKISAAILVFAMSFNQQFVFAGTDTATITVTDGTLPISGAVVYALQMGSQGFVPVNSSTGTTDGSGAVAFSTLDFSSGRYKFLVSANGHGPLTISQMSNPAQELSATGNLTIALPDVLTGRGTITISVSNATHNKMVFGNIRKISTQRDIGFGACVADNSGNCNIVVPNMPVAAGGTYDGSVFDPTANKSNGGSVSAAVTSGGNAVHAINLNGGLPPDLSANSGDQSRDNSQRQQQNTGGGTVEGVVEDVNYSTMTIPFGWINLMQRGENGNVFGAGGSSVDQNGRFHFLGLQATSYYVQTGGGCIQNTSTCYTGYSSTGTITGEVELNDFVITDTSTVKVIHVKLTRAAAGTAKIGVKVVNDQGNPIPQAWVSLWPDGGQWATAGTALACNGSDGMMQNPGYTQKNEQATTGTVVLSSVTPGNYGLNIGTPFSQGGTNFNAGADGTYNWGNGPQSTRGCTTGGQNVAIAGSADDLRLSVSTVTNKVGVYDVTGRIVAGATTTVNGIETVTVTIPTLHTASGTVSGTVTFSDVADLRTDPITIVLQGNCGSNGCQGNYAVIGGTTTTPAKTYTYTMNVPPTGSYYMQVISNYWGVVRAGGGGNDQVTFGTGVTSITRDMKMAPAGRVRGFLKKPDGSIAIPGNNSSGFVSYGVNANGQNAWGNTQVGNDGSFILGGLLPGVYTLEPQVWGSGDASFATKEPSDKVTILAGKDLTQDVQFVNGQAVSIDMDVTGILPLLHNHVSANEGYMGDKIEVRRVKAGTKLDSDFIFNILGSDNGNRSRFQYEPAMPLGGPCGPTNAAGWCGAYVPSGTDYDMYAMRSGDMDSDTNTYMYFSFLANKKDVVIDKNHLGSSIVINGSTVPAVHVVMSAAPGAGVTIKGTVIATHIFRQVDFESFGGNFDNFIKFIPTISVIDSDGKLVAAGLVTPAPSEVGQGAPKGAAIDAAIQSGDFAGFLNVVKDLSWAYEIRGVPASKAYTLVGATPNYPSLTKNVTAGGNGTTLTWNINWDTEAGAGGTITGTVKDSGGTAIPSATVTVKARGIKTKSLTTAADGTYKAEGLPAGLYKVLVAADTFAPAAKRQAITGAESKTVDFALVAGPGIVSGTIREIDGTLIKPVAGARLLAYDDTANVASPGEPLAPIKGQSGTDGTYQLLGLKPGDVYKINVRAPGRYLETVSVTATGGTVTQDVTLRQKPLDIAVVISKVDTNIEFKILNPNNFDSGTVWYYDSAAAFSLGTATDISASFTQRADGSLVATLPTSTFTSGVTYKLRIDGVPADGSPDVIKELTFGLSIPQSSQSSIDSALSGDDEDNANQVTGGDNTSLVFDDPGTMLGSSQTDLPTANVSGQDAPAQAPQLPGAQSRTSLMLAGKIYQVTLSNVQTTSRKVQLNISYDPETVGANIGNLVIYLKNTSTGQYEALPGTVTVDPVAHVASILIDLSTTLAAQVGISNVKSSQAGVGTMAVGRMNALSNGKTFSVNPRALSTGVATFAVGVSQTGGVTAAGYHQYNFPNPFDFKTKTVTLRSGTSGVASSIRGTYIVVSPTGTGTVGIRVRIYNVAGDMVREFQTTGAAGQYNYIEWDGKNTSGDDVASGVYFASVDAPGAPKKEPIKMVVVK